MNERDFDLIVLGGGPAGYAGALRAAGQKARVALIEKDLLGGTCLNRGCIPTKCYYHSTKAYSRLIRKVLPEIVFENLSIDYGAMLRRKNGVVAALREGLATLLGKMGVSVFHGSGAVGGRNEVRIVEGRDGGKTLKAMMVLVATGSVPALLPFIPKDERIHTTDTIWDMDKAPLNLLIIGGGVIGVEAASIYSSISKKVTLVEILPDVLVNVNKSLKRVVVKSLKERGVEILTGKRVSQVRADKELEVTIDGEDGTRRFDSILLSVGRKPLTESVFDEGLPIDLENGFIKVGSDMQTSVKGIYAAGDVIGMPMLAHAASREAITAVNRGMGLDRADEYRPDLVPDVIFSDPEIAQIGKVPDSTAKREDGISVGRFPYIASSKAMCEGESEGFAEIVYDKINEKIIGGAIVGANASDLIGEVLLAVNAGVSPELIEKSVHPHPTLTEIIWEASADTIGKAIYKVRR